MRGYSISRVQVLYKDKKSYVVYMEAKPQKFRFDDGEEMNVYIMVPIESNGKMMKITALGKAVEIRKFLQRIEEAGLKFRILSLTDAKFGLDSPLSLLTEKQRKVLVTAYKHGCYDVPRG